MPQPYHQLLEAHYTRRWGPVAERVPVREDRLSPAFRVLVIPCRDDATAYATCGMSSPEEDYRLEVFLLVRRGCPPGPPPGSGVPCGLVDLVAAVAYYHVTGAPLGLHHTVNFGQPWMEGSTCTHGYLSLPYLDGPELEWLDEPEVRFLWLIPITERELEFKKRHGAEALEERLEEAQFNYLDPTRASVV